MFLRALFDQMDNMKKIPKSPELSGDGKVEEGYEIIGVLPEELRKLYILKMKVIEMYNNRVTEHMNQVAQAIMRGVLSDLREINSTHLLASRVEVELIDSIFWTEVRFAFPQTIKKGTLAIYADWQLGWCQDPEANPIALLRSLMRSD